MAHMTVREQKGLRPGGLGLMLTQQLVGRTGLQTKPAKRSRPYQIPLNPTCIRNHSWAARFPVLLLLFSARHFSSTLYPTHLLFILR